MSKEKFIQRAISEEYPDPGFITREGYKENNKKCDFWIYYYSTTLKQSEGHYENGKLNGKWIWWWPDNQGKLAEGNFKKGKKHGKFTFWDINGNKWLEGNYLDGKRKGKFHYYYLIDSNMNRPGLNANRDILERFDQQYFGVHILLQEWFEEFMFFEIDSSLLIYRTAPRSLDFGPINLNTKEEKENYLVRLKNRPDLLTIEEEEELDFNLFLDEEEKEQIMFCTIGAANFLNKFLKKCDVLIDYDEELKEGVMSKDRLQEVLNYTLEDAPKITFRNRVRDAFYQSGYTKHEQNLINMGRSDMETFLIREELVIQSYCECLREYQVITKEREIMICDKCDQPYSYLDRLYL